MSWHRWPEDDEPAFQNENLHPVDTSFSPSPELPAHSPTIPEVGLRKSPRGPSDPGNAILLANLGPNITDLIRPHYGEDYTTSPSEHSSTAATLMQSSGSEKVQCDEQSPPGLSEPRGSSAIERHDSANTVYDKTSELASSALAVSDTQDVAASEPRELLHAGVAQATIVASAQDAEPRASSPVQKAPRSAARSPLRVQTTPSLEMQPPPSVGETFADSPTLAKYAISVGHRTADTLPAVQPTSPMQDREPASPQKERLPSFRQLTGQLSELAEAAATAATQTQEAHLYSHHHSQSFGSAASQSPRLPHHTPAYPGSTQTSPSNYYAQSIRSPTSTITEAPYPTYGSPQQYATPAAYYSNRRTSGSTGTTGLFPPSLPSASTSSGESHGHPASSVDGYSTSHTTPTDPILTVDGTPRPLLPPPVGMQGSAVLMAGFKCEFSRCTAEPFQTQYLLRYVFYYSFVRMTRCLDSTCDHPRLLPKLTSSTLTCQTSPRPKSHST